MLPSTHILSVTKTGFREYVQSGLALSGNQSAELNLALEVGAVSEQLEVSAAAPLSDTQTSNKSGTLNTNMVENFPVSDRTALSLITATLAGGTIGYGLSTIFGSSAADDQNVARFNLFGGR